MPAGRTGGGKGQKRGREAAGLEEDFLEMCEEEAEKRAAGERRWVAHEVVEEGLARKGHAKEAIAQVLNKLLKARKVQVFNNKDGLCYMVTPKEHAEQFQDLGSEELLVYQNIKAAGNLGIWTRDLKQQSNLQQPQINKILKTLEGREIIKSVKSVQNKNRKVYMLFELEPSKEITGGAWYTDQEFDGELIAKLQAECFKFVQEEEERNGGETVSVGAVAEHIKNEGLSHVELSEKEVSSVLKTLVYSGKLACEAGEEGQPEEDEYKVNTVQVPEDTVLKYVPCVDDTCGKCFLCLWAKQGGVPIN